MIDFVQWQNDIYAALLNCEALLDVQILQYRQFKTLSEVQQRVALTTPRAGKSGALIMVEMPKVRCAKPNLPGPQFDLAFPISVVTMPAINDVPGKGTGIDAENIGEWVHDTLHRYRFSGRKGFELISDSDAMSSVNSFANGTMRAEDGVLCYRNNFRMTIGRDQTGACDMPAYAIDGSLVVTLTNGANSPAADIYVSLDGNYPTKLPIPGNGSFKYNGPFQAASGQTVRWAAYLSPYRQSACGNEQVT